ncbi:MAG TPA: BlaI/MecI/CopY family transcriptional regulator [Candidatus Hydrogenedentes bacterium]|nr:BlaI/MecI/CopY family transcriptional regulator [Candidatus Hydrogenedentota bacterium]
MGRPTSKHPTELELEILKILWRDGPGGVREVKDALEGFRKLALTSVTTIMNIMVDKKYLKRTKEDGRYVYRSRVSKASTLRRMLGDLVERAFEGSAAAAMVNLLETSDVDASELEELRRLIEQKSMEGMS